MDVFWVRPQRSAQILWVIRLSIWACGCFCSYYDCQLRHEEVKAIVNAEVDRSYDFMVGQQQLLHAESCCGVTA